MSEEAAFLEALKANPADDTARLVYADWLDEHGEPAKAEYLRLVATLAQTEQDYAPDQPDVARLLAVVKTLDGDWEWRYATGSRFKLIFYCYLNTAKKISIIKTLREVTGRGLAEAKRIVESPPSVLFESRTFEQIFSTRETLREAESCVYIHPCERSDRPVACFFDIVASREATDPLSNPTRASDCEAGFATFLQTAMNVGAVEARRLAKNHSVTIARYQDPVVAGEKVRTLQQHIEWVPFDDDYPE